MSKILQFMSKLNQMKFKILFELYMFIGVIFGQSIYQIFFKKSTDTTIHVIFVIGIVYTIWWFYYLIKPDVISIKKYLINIINNNKMITVKVGDNFIASYKNGKRVIKLVGKIQINHGAVYLCQNEIAGASCNDKLEYKHSWYISPIEKFNNASLKQEYINNFKIEFIMDKKGIIKSLFFFLILVLHT